MKLKDALENVNAPQGMVILASILSGNFETIESSEVTEALSSEAKEKLEQAQNRCNEAISHRTYWWDLAEFIKWQAIVSILEAAQFVGSENLPDAAPPDTSSGILMEIHTHIREYGEEILEKAKEQALKGK